MGSALEDDAGRRAGGDAGTANDVDRVHELPEARICATPATDAPSEPLDPSEEDLFEEFRRRNREHFAAARRRHAPGTIVTGLSTRARLDPAPDGPAADVVEGAADGDATTM